MPGLREGIKPVLTPDNAGGGGENPTGLVFPKNFKLEEWSKTSRAKLIEDYNKVKVEPVFFEPSEDIEKSVDERFLEYTVKWLGKANKPYDSREGYEGVWYAEDFVKKYGASGEKNNLINFMANKHYWDIGIFGRFQESGKGYTPSERLSSFFKGPAIAECGSLLQACQLRALEELIGTEAFNNYFGKPLTPFILTHVLFNPIFTADSEIAKNNPNVDLLARYKGEKPAGVVIEDSDANLSLVKQVFLKDNDIEPDRVRIVGAPYIKRWNEIINMMEGFVSDDYYMHDANRYDVFVMKVTEYSEHGQLLQLIPKVHDAGKKLIVVTDDKKSLGELIKKLLKEHMYKKEEKRLTDRVQHLFLGGILPLEEQEVKEGK